METTQNLMIINITDRADSDGAGCAILTNIIPENLEGYDNVTKYIVPAPRNAVDNMLEELLLVIKNPELYENCDSEYKSLVDIESRIVNDTPHEIWLIVTDVPVGEEIAKKLISYNQQLNRIKVKTMVFDHHPTNLGILHAASTTASCDISELVGGYRVDSPGFMAVVLHCPCTLNIPEIRSKTNFGEMRLRSATMIYYAEFLRSEIFENKAEPLGLFAYEISQYDTFEFKSHPEDWHCKNPDAYALYFNLCGFDKFVEELTPNLKYFLGWYQELPDVYEERVTHHSTSEYPLLFTTASTPHLSRVIETLIIQRDKSYDFAKKDLRFTLMEISTNVSCKCPMSTYSDDDDLILAQTDDSVTYNIGLIPNMTNVSYIGNRISEEYDSLDCIIFFSAETQTISMRTIHDDVDLSKISTIFGGGGHKKAAGAKVNPAQIMRFLEMYFKAMPLSRYDEVFNEVEIEE